MICLYIYMRQRYRSLSLRNILDLVSIINSHFVRYKELGLEINTVEKLLIRLQESLGEMQLTSIIDNELGISSGNGSSG